MRKLWMALLTVVALAVGAALGEDGDGKSDKACKDGPACCCCSESCPK